MVLTLIIAVIYVAVILVGYRYDKTKAELDLFMSPEYTNLLKGLCCILVVIVHVPQHYTNPLQQVIGGFSQISVTLYFLFSAFGIVTSIKNKPNYLSGFWKNRVLVLLVPFAISVLVKCVFGYHPGSGGTYFVFVLCFFYIVTYLAARYFPQKMSYIVCSCVILYSIIGSITEKLWWPTQALGFAYGVVISECLPSLKKWLTKSHTMKMSLCTMAAVVLTLSYAVFKETIPRGASVLLQNAMVFAIILWIFVVTVYARVGNTVSKYLGVISYDVFLYHGFAQGVLLSLANRIPNWCIPSGVFLALMLALSIVISAAMHRVNAYVVRFIKTCQ